MPRFAPSLILAAGISVGLISAAALSAWNPGSRESAAVASLDALANDLKGATQMTIDPNDPNALAQLLAELESKRVVYVGETHDRYDHHLNQLAIIRGLHERGVDVAVGMEFFQEPFQGHLDRYVAGEIPEKALLKHAEYYERWRFDYRLYRDILEYARTQKIPLVALNAPTELVAKVSRAGLDALAHEDRARLPADLDRSQPAYEARLRPIFEMHGRASEERFRRFVDVQMLWDEHMARVARDYLAANPANTLIVLAGSGHVAYPDAIPGRLARMLPAEHAIVLTGPPSRFAGGRFDFSFVERDVDLPPAGRLGVALASDDTAVTLSGVSPGSPADATGLRPGDRVLSIAGERIEAPGDVTLALLDRGPGEEVWVEIERRSEGESASRFGGAVTLF